MCASLSGFDRGNFHACLIALGLLSLMAVSLETSRCAAQEQAIEIVQADDQKDRPDIEASAEDQEETQKQADSDELTDRIRGQDPKAATERKVPKAIDVYMGRRVAKTMHFAGAEWLIRDNRERQERCSLMLANLGLKPGMTVCDMGCGNGFYSLPIARMLGEHGLVVGVDVQPEMLGFLRERAESEGIENIVPILGSYHNPRLPPDSIDLVLMVDVYHEFSHPQEMLAAIRKSLTPSGLVVLVEYREEDPKVPIRPLHKMSRAQVDKELTANGFKLAKEFDGLPWQHMMFYGIDASKNADKDSEAEQPDKSAPIE